MMLENKKNWKMILENKKIGKWNYKTKELFTFQSDNSQ